TGAVSAGRLSVDEEHVLAGAPGGGHWARDPDARALRIEALDSERVALQVGSAVAAGCETEATELGRHVRRDLIELRARRRAAEHLARAGRAGGTSRRSCVGVWCRACEDKA